MDSRTARNNSKRGKRHELRLARRLDMAKIGPLNDAVDLLGDTWKVQVKTHKGLPPAKIAAIQEPVRIDPAPKYVRYPAERMEGLYPDLWPMVIHSYLPGPGYRPLDFVWVLEVDWLDLYGDIEDAEIGAWLVMSLDHFLDVHGTD